jgi:hypothetical protein
MNKKNSMIQANDSLNTITEQDLSAEMVELSDETLSQVRGGWDNDEFAGLDCDYWWAHFGNSSCEEHEDLPTLTD